MASPLIKISAVAIAAGLALVGCSSADNSSQTAETAAASASSEATSTVTVEDNFGTVEITTPVQRVAATDNRTFEILDAWGVNVVAAPKTLVPATVQGIKSNEEIVDLGTHREPNLEALVAAEPDLIISGQRFSQYYEDMKTLNPDVPIIDLEPREGEPLVDELKRQVTELGKIFGKEAEAKEMADALDAAIARAQEAYNGTDTVMAVNVSGGEVGYIAPTVGRTFGPVFDILNLTPALEVEGASSNHEGDDISVEAIAGSNPNWIFVLDRDGATSAATEEGYTPALDVIAASPALQNVAAVQDNRVVLAPADTYTNESIVTYTEIFNQIADAFEQANS
ncbi:siderophore ABC transporter substrate-binding protein [Corynebacterium kozikiae]|uniref:siderophore ABC transporter substrate-binding protein n=1 Tax=Corynebacterium kozikiae TaxID=2968469 RepID=UPI00211CE82C|nr:ABC transporter substrate-binding protein [Corynebacterium sp. 76QC2CO]MCQ9344277.1 ABC transporter substrate-binding protein [Corynebacterium sp. 76QC2CO]